MVALISKRMISRSVLEKREQAFGFTSDWRRMLPRVFFAFFFSTQTHLSVFLKLVTIVIKSICQFLIAF